jgi:Domain of unknown function (DUF4265)
MKYQAGEYEAVHKSPIWRDRANFVFAVHIGVKSGENEWEQLWGQKTAPQRFILCCIPFFACDIALGDEVETDADFVLQRVVQRSGQMTFRVWLVAQNSITREELIREIEAMTPLVEWSSENLLALSVPEAQAQQLANSLHAWEQKGVLQYETGRSNVSPKEST